jgi:hypothetical protein
VKEQTSAYLEKSPARSRTHCAQPGRREGKGRQIGRKPKLTAHQQHEARRRIDAGETQRSVSRNYCVSQATISRLTP